MMLTNAPNSAEPFLTHWSALVTCRKCASQRSTTTMQLLPNVKKLFEGDKLKVSPFPYDVVSARNGPNTIIIYETLILYLRDSRAARIFGARRTLDEYLVSMASDNIVGAIISSLECRKILLELSSKLGLADNPTLRNALRADEERVEGLLIRIFDSKLAEDYVLSLKGDPAQNFLDVVQAALDKGFLIAQKHSQKAGRIIRKLSESCDTLPSSLFVTGVTGREQHPTFGGGYGDIYRASYGITTVALKHMRHFLRGADSRSLRLKFCREALVWKDLHHPHILRFIGIDRESFPSSLCMVSPWMEHGTVLQYVKEHGPANVDRLLFEIAQGLHYLHSCNIVHGDLRGTNILVNEDWSACLTDFGLSVFSNASAPMNSQTRAGSIRWMAPELIAPDRFGYEFARTPATDVYAFGCVCVELYTGRPPFSELSEGSALLKIIDGERAARPSGIPAMSDILWQHVMEYWAESPVARPTVGAVVQHMVCPGAAPKPKPSRRLRPLPLPNMLRPLPNTPRPPPRHNTFPPDRMIKNGVEQPKRLRPLPLPTSLRPLPSTPPRKNALAPHPRIRNDIPGEDVLAKQPGSSKDVSHITEWWTVRYEYAPKLPDELFITTGEVMRMLSEYTDGWALCEDVRGKKGLVPVECLKPMRAGIPNDQGLLSLVNNDALSDLSENATFPSISVSTGREQRISAGNDTQRSNNCELTPRIISMNTVMPEVFQQLEIGVGNTTRLSQRLATVPEDISTNAITEFHRNCIESQKLISGQISWGPPDAERPAEDQEARDVLGKRDSVNVNGSAGNRRVSDLATPGLTREEVLLQDLLAATEGLLEAFRLKRMAIEGETPPPAYGA
ncbi:kinase-like domain-containing protein [Mycena vulgaris]|nr:kinase-like domain-containing protein [Mycena vulgaris]